MRVEARLVVPVDTIHGVCDDEEDDLVLATAIAGGVRYLVSGDKGMRNIGRYQDVTILTPRAFLNLLDQQSDEPDEL